MLISVSRSDDAQALAHDFGLATRMDDANSKKGASQKRCSCSVLTMQMLICACGFEANLNAVKSLSNSKEPLSMGSSIKLCYVPSSMASRRGASLA